MAVDCISIVIVKLETYCSTLHVSPCSGFHALIFVQFFCLDLLELINIEVLFHTEHKCLKLKLRLVLDTLTADHFMVYL